MSEATGAPWLRVLGELGRGATGAVELGELTRDFAGRPAGHRVAVKTLRSPDPRAVEAFRREAAIGASLRDPGLVEVLHHGERDGLPFLVMTYVPGRSLAERLGEHGPLPEPVVRSLGAQVAGALARLHDAGVRHGDVKPENVRLDDEGRAVLVDLGFAGPMDGPAGAAADGATAGSLRYLSPERAVGGPPSAASDVFALGLALYEAAVGRHPFAPVGRGRDDPARWLGSLTACRYVPPSHRAPRLSPFLDACLADVLARDPLQRPGAGELSERLRDGEAGLWWRERVHAEGPDARAATTREHLTALVGRTRELVEFEELLRALERDRRGAICWLSGSEGMGKSRLVEEVAGRARQGPAAPMYLYTRCTEIAESRPSGVLLDLVRRWLALPRGAVPSAGDVAEIERLVAPDEARALLEALSPAPPPEEDDDETRAMNAALVATGIARWLVALARERPVLVFVDDVHRSSAVTRRILVLAARDMEGSRLFLVLGQRDDERVARESAPLERELRQSSERERGPEWRSIRLQPLGERDVEALVERLFSASTPRLRLARVLWLRSRGNPGLLAEILRGLLASGAARPRDERGGGRDGGRLVLSIRPEELRLPGSLQRSIAERFRLLEPDERRWLERLAVVGGRILPDFLQRAFPDADRGEIDDVLARLERLGWLTAAGERYRFARPALREAVYRAVAPKRRARAHASAARALRPDEGAPPPEDAFQRAFHLRAAGEHEELLRCLEELQGSPFLRAQPQRTYNLARWGLEALDALGGHARDASRLRLLEIAADTADRLGMREEGRRLLDQLADLFPDGEEDPAAAARVYLLHGRFSFATGQFGLARGMLRNAELFARKSGDGVLVSESLRRMSNVLAQVGELEAAARFAERATRAAASDLQWVLARLAAAVVDLVDDRPDGAAQAVDQAVRRLRRAREAPGVRALAHLLRARVWRSAGRPGRALGAAARALRLARSAGERRLEAEAAARLGGLYLDADRPEEAEDLLREALLVADEIEDRRGQILGNVFLAILLWEQNDPSARATAVRAVERAREIGYQRAEAVALSILARMDREAGDVDAALEATERAFALVAERGAELFDRIVVAGTRALVLETAGRGREAARIVGELKRRMRRMEKRLERLSLAREWREYSGELLALVLSPEGNVYPRRGTV